MKTVFLACCIASCIVFLNARNIGHINIEDGTSNSINLAQLSQDVSGLQFRNSKGPTYSDFVNSKYGFVIQDENGTIIHDDNLARSVAEALKNIRRT